jgi:BirA family biotin operon repressor/biotin-[acetyl-CoA-carboxylase] ligase
LLSNIQSRGLENKTYQALSIGMNVNSAIDIKAIDVGAKVSSTSVLLELGNEVDREALLKLIIENIDPAIQKQEYL